MVHQQYPFLLFAGIMAAGLACAADSSKAAGGRRSTAGGTATCKSLETREPNAANQQPAFPGPIGIEIRSPVGNDKGIGKHRAKPLQRIMQPSFAGVIRFLDRKRIGQVRIGFLGLHRQIAEIGQYLS